MEKIFTSDVLKKTKKDRKGGRMSNSYKSQLKILGGVFINFNLYKMQSTVLFSEWKLCYVGNK